MIQAIETTYKGIKFRSRLEAKWAFFFDETRITWDYEKEGYDVNGIRYLPDFILHNVNDSDIIFEVKGAKPDFSDVIKLNDLGQHLGMETVLSFGALPRPILISGGIKEADFNEIEAGWGTFLLFDECIHCHRKYLKLNCNYYAHTCGCLKKAEDIMEKHLDAMLTELGELCRWGESKTYNGGEDLYFDLRDRVVPAFSFEGSAYQWYKSNLEYAANHKFGAIA